MRFILFYKTRFDNRRIEIGNIQNWRFSKSLLLLAFALLAAFFALFAFLAFVFFELAEAFSDHCTSPPSLKTKVIILVTIYCVLPGF